MSLAQAARELSKSDISAGEESEMILRGFLLPDTAACIHAELMRAFIDCGFDVYPEFQVSRVGMPGRKRIDIVVIKNCGRVAIELDARRPRKKSIEKLRWYPGYRIIGLRGVEGSTLPDGIDAIVSVPVRIASVSERLDKRTVSRLHK